jgi:serine/threonine-protein kinase 19
MGRRKYNEIMQKELEKRKLQSSGLGVLFHLRDLFGSRKLTRVETTCGTMIRLRKD